MVTLKIHLKIPVWLDRLCAFPFLVYRRLRFGYSFRLIPLAGGKAAIVDPQDYYWLNHYDWFLKTQNNLFYAECLITENGKTKWCRMHRLITNAPPGILIDHHNNYGLDNRRENLRQATWSQNNSNRQKTKSKTSSRFIGVYFRKDIRRWCARIRHNKIETRLGYFDSEIEAAKVYDQAAVKYRGEFAKLNFPPQDYMAEDKEQVKPKIFRANSFNSWLKSVSICVLFCILAVLRSFCMTDSTSSPKTETFDVIVIGSGPGGYFAAIRCSQKGARVAIIEKAEIGGTCLNRGCVPSKTLLASAELFLQVKNAEAMGIEITSVSVNWAKWQQRKDAIVAAMRKGLTGLLQANKIRIYEGVAFCTSPKTVVVEKAKGKMELTATKGVIIATGSEPVEIPALPFDGKTIISSNEALSLADVPKSMVVVGGGYVGCELACVYAAVGTKVTIVEALENIINNEDAWVSRLLEREFKKQGIDVLTSQKVVSIITDGTVTKVVLESGKAINTEKVLVAVGRRAVCDGRTIENLKLQTKGPIIKVNDKMQTNVAGVYAIGDAVGTTFLAHGAFAEAEVAAENILGGDRKIGDYELVPKVIFTFPEVASVGKNEKACAKEGIDFVVGRGFFRANGRSMAHNEMAGEIRVVREKASAQILGVTMVGAKVTEFIASARLLIGTNEKFDDVSFPHPTVSEVLKEAWEDAFGMSVHQMPKRKTEDG
jgi:dihydrolipoamide dehydrogenase